MHRNISRVEQYGGGYAMSPTNSSVRLLCIIIGEKRYSFMYDSNNVHQPCMQAKQANTSSADSRKSRLAVLLYTLYRGDAQWGEILFEIFKLNKLIQRSNSLQILIQGCLMHVKLSKQAATVSRVDRNISKSSSSHQI